MNETTPFFESLLFWIPFSLFIGAIFGFFVAAMCASSSQASRDEGRWEREAKILDECEKKASDARNMEIVTQGTPDRE